MVSVHGYDRCIARYKKEERKSMHPRRVKGLLHCTPSFSVAATYVHTYNTAFLIRWSIYCL